MLLNLSCPAVSHNCNLIGVPSATLSTRAKKSTPTVGSDTSKNEPSVKHLSRELLPTPESPIRMTLNWYSKKGSIGRRNKINYFVINSQIDGVDP